MSDNGPPSSARPRPGEPPRREGLAGASLRVRVVRSAPDEYTVNFTPVDESVGALGVSHGLLDFVTDLLMEQARDEEEGHEETK